MAKSKSDRLAALHAEWMRRFGQPPPIITGAALLAKVLRDAAGSGERR